MIILGIETSCDETAAAIVTDKKKILSNIVFSQIKEHLEYGGVVPEIAARAHMEHLDIVINKAVDEAGISLKDVDAIATTCGPGLIGGVIVGTMMGKAMALALDKPFIAVNHLEGHALTARLTSDVEFPFLLLLLSGGHCQILLAEGVGKYAKLGGTIDDALGEAFDKVAKMLGLGYPGGPIVEQMALKGDENRFKFPKPLCDQKNCDFSFSGLKTSVLRVIEGLGTLNDKDIFDICASFQRTIAEILIRKSKFALNLAPEVTVLVLAGGVAANQFIYKELENNLDIELIAPPIKLCTDNAAMIAWAGIERFRLGMSDNLNFAPKSRWSL